MYRMSLLLLSGLVMAVAPALAAAPVSITFAEQTVRLLRDKSFYLTGRGAHLRNGDIVESGSGSIQIDGAGACTLALGPASRLHVRIGAGATDYVLLDGWLKIQARAAGAGAPLSVAAPGMRIDPAAAAFILHVSAGKTELFVESGQPLVTQPGSGTAARRAGIAREQYAVGGRGQALKVMTRAPREFLGTMPPAFFDALVPVAARGAAAVPKLERAATFADIAPWVAHQPELRQNIYRRFHPPRPAPAAPGRPIPRIAKDPS